MAEAPAVPEAPQEAPVESTESTTTPPAPAEQAESGPTLEELKAALAKTRNEAAGYRVKLKELEPLAKKQLEADEANKDEITKAQERAQAAEKAFEDQATLNTQLNLAVTYHLPPDDIEFIGSGTLEEMEDRAKRIAAKNAAVAKVNPPPTQQPIEGLRPGASPEPASPPDDSYPEQWKPKWLRGDGESRIQHGQ